MEEIWKDVQGYEGTHQVSNLGIIKSIDRYVVSPWDSLAHKTGRTLKFKTNKFGYYEVGLSKNNKQRWFKVHRIIAIAFIPNPENKPTINHLDGNKKNNELSNLCWATHSENQKHAYMYLGKKVPAPWKGKFGKDNWSSKVVSQYTMDGIFIRDIHGTIEAERLTGTCHSNISAACKGRLNSAGGYKWKYANPK